jgi:hypothetical protein
VTIAKKLCGKYANFSHKSLGFLQAANLYANEEVELGWVSLKMS